MLNGMELLCDAARRSGPDLNFDCGEPPPVTQLVDALNMEHYLNCRADGINSAAGNSIVRDLPTPVIDALASFEAESVGDSTGAYAAAVHRLRGVYA